MPRTYEPPAATSKRDREPAAGANSRKAAKKQHSKKQGSSKASEGMESAESGACVSTTTERPPTLPTTTRTKQPPTVSFIPATNLGSAFVPDFVERVVAAVTEVKDDEGSSADAREAAFWKHKFEELQALRMTAPEQRLANLQSKMDTQEKAMNKVASSVRSMMKRSRNRATPSAEQASRSSSSSAEEEEEEEEGAVEVLEAKLEQKREMLRFYQKLTGIVVEPVQLDEEDEEEDEEPDTMTCTAINHIHKRAVKFDLQLSGESDHVLFVPTANAALLPTALRVSAELLTSLADRTET